jgi:hypothetical protein
MNGIETSNVNMETTITPQTFIPLARAQKAKEKKRR